MWTFPVTDSIKGMLFQGTPPIKGKGSELPVEPPASLFQPSTDPCIYCNNIAVFLANGLIL